METLRKQFAFYPRFIIPRTVAWTSAGNIPLYLRESSTTPISLPTASDREKKKMQIALYDMPAKSLIRGL